MKYTARFVPQAWINDYAVDTDAEGPDIWDCTDEVVGNPDLRSAIDAEIDADDISGEALDRDDRLKSDPVAPQWVRDWSGPFSIYVTREES